MALAYIQELVWAALRAVALIAAHVAPLRAPETSRAALLCGHWALLLAGLVLLEVVFCAGRARLVRSPRAVETAFVAPCTFVGGVGLVVHPARGLRRYYLIR